MATMADVDKLALAMPDATKNVDGEGRPTYLVHDKMFCFHRSPRRDAVDTATGERLEDVFVFRVADLDVKELILGDPRGIFFTTPHWNGYAAVLIRIPDLALIDDEELGDLVAEAWLTRAQKRLAKAWLAEHAPRGLSPTRPSSPAGASRGTRTSPPARLRQASSSPSRSWSGRTRGARRARSARRTPPCRSRP